MKILVTSDLSFALKEIQGTKVLMNRGFGYEHELFTIVGLRHSCDEGEIFEVRLEKENKETGWVDVNNVSTIAEARGELLSMRKTMQELVLHGKPVYEREVSDLYLRYAGDFQYLSTLP